MSTVIKVGESARIARRLSTVDLADHLAEAQAVIAEARRRAVQITNTAEEEAGKELEKARESGHEMGREAGYEEGFAEGKRAAFESARESFQRDHAAAAASLLAATGQFEAMKEELRLAATRDLLEFAMMVAERLTLEIGRRHRGAAAENLQRALAIVARKTDLTIRVHPADAATLRTFASSVVEQLNAARSVSIVEDDTIDPGGCVVRNEQMEVDASLETQLREIASLLTGKGSDD